jgi:ferredoxin-like protein FixX
MNRYEQVKRCIPDLVTPNFHSGESCLYVGGNLLRVEMAHELKKTGFEITLLEIFKPYCEAMEKSPKFAGIFSEIICGSIQGFKPERVWDLIVWWHGPEHIVVEELPTVISDIEKMAKKLVVFACPHGVYRFDEAQTIEFCKKNAAILGSAEANMAEVHVAALYPEFFENLGYKVNAMGSGTGSNLLAWKHL